MSHEMRNDEMYDDEMYSDEIDVDVLDRFARFYDQDYRAYDMDLEPILTLAEGVGGPVLEVGCGTGRVVEPLVRYGYDVTGVDISPGLLQRAKEKLATLATDEDAHDLGSVRWVQADIRALDLAQTHFGLATCTSNTLMHIVAPDGQLQALTRISAHLRTGGILYLDLFNPDVARLVQADSLMELADRWIDDETGSEVIKWSVRSVDFATQLQDTLFIYEEIQPDGTGQRTVCPFTLRFLWRHEAELMLQQAGFEVLDVWGDCDGTPYAGDSEHLILLARKL